MSVSERLTLGRLHPGAASSCIDPSAVPNNLTDGSREPAAARVGVASATNANTLVVVDPEAVGNANAEATSGPMQRTRYPYVTGTSVLGLTFKGGVMVAADTLGSYGSTKRYKSVHRVRDVGKKIVIGASGELSDFNYIMTLLDEIMTDEFCCDDGADMDPREIHEYLVRVLYNRRNKMDPLWNSLVIAGVDTDPETGDAVPFLGNVGMLGTHFTDKHTATGFGQHLARPLFRQYHRDDMSEEEAEALIKKALTVCFYRDKNSINKFTLKSVTKDGIKTKGPFSVDTSWKLKAFENPTKDSVGGW